MVKGAKSRATLPRQHFLYQRPLGISCSIPVSVYVLGFFETTRSFYSCKMYGLLRKAFTKRVQRLEMLFYWILPSIILPVFRSNRIAINLLELRILLKSTSHVPAPMVEVTRPNADRWAGLRRVVDVGSTETKTMLLDDYLLGMMRWEQHVLRFRLGPSVGVGGCFAFML
jgi:hypothetical protein